MTQPIQPIFILPEGSQRTTGKNAQKNNILAAQTVSEHVKTTLGPKGMDKLIVDNNGEITVTNDGVTILKQLEVEHPVAKMLIEVSKTQEAEVGDGTTTAVILSGELLKKAQQLLENEIHPSTIIKGYRKAAEQAQKILLQEATTINETHTETLQKIAETAMTGKGAEKAKQHLAKLCVNATLAVIENPNQKINKKLIKIEKKTGGAIESSKLVQGIIIDKEKLHPQMPTNIQQAKIALLDTSIEIKSTETDSKIQITDPTQLQTFLDMEEQMLKEKVEKIKQTGANVIFCQKGIDELAQHYLAKENILAARRITKNDIENISKATGAKIITNLKEITPNDLGTAGTVKEEQVGEDTMIYIQECQHPKAVTILLRGASEQVTQEAKRTIEDAIGDLTATLEDQKAISGAGAIEIQLSQQLKNYSNTQKGREQLAINAFAEAIEIIPKTLAENSGIDPIDILTELKNAHQNQQKNTGINAHTGKTTNAWEQGIIEPLRIKQQAISSATEVTTMILRIDDIIITGNHQQKNTPTNPLIE